MGPAVANVFSSIFDWYPLKPVRSTEGTADGVLMDPTALGDNFVAIQYHWSASPFTLLCLHPRLPPLDSKAMQN